MLGGGSSGGRGLKWQVLHCRTAHRHTAKGVEQPSLEVEWGHRDMTGHLLSLQVLLSEHVVATCDIPLFLTSSRGAVGQKHGRSKGSEEGGHSPMPRSNGRGAPSLDPPLPALWGTLLTRRKPGLLHVCTRGDQHKAQEENGLVSSLQDQRYFFVHTKMACGHRQMNNRTTAIRTHFYRRAMQRPLDLPWSACEFITSRQDLLTRRRLLTPPPPRPGPPTKVPTFQQITWACSNRPTLPAHCCW